MILHLNCMVNDEIVGKPHTGTEYGAPGVTRLRRTLPGALVFDNRATFHYEGDMFQRFHML